MLIGCVGKPSTGKSTFFKAMTLAEVMIAAYPFTTIKPNRGFGYVKIDCVDKDFNVQCNPRFGYCIEHKRFVPVELIDVAGLVPGAHMGLGLGNEFLDDLRQADVLIHIVDVSGSTNEKGDNVPTGSYDPLNDIRFLEEEIDLWFLSIMKKSWEKMARQMQQEHKEPYKEIAKQFSGLKVTEDLAKLIIDKLKLNREDATKWSEDDLLNFAREIRKATKPMVIAANKIDIPGADKNFERLKAEFPDYIIVPCSAESEVALKEAAKHELIKYIPGDGKFEVLQLEKLNEKQMKALEFIDVNVLHKFGGTGVQQALDEAVFKLLKYIAIYPGGVGKLVDSEGRVLPDCFLMPPNTTALDFAFKLHTDFGKNFIRAIDVKKKMPVGKDHKLQHRDVVEIVAGR